MRLRLAGDERVIVKTHGHGRVLRWPTAAFLLLVVATTFALGWLNRENLPEPLAQARALLQATVPIVAAVLAVFWCLLPLLRWRRTVVFLTNRRLLVRRGVGANRQWEVPLVLIRELQVSQSLFERGSGAGTLELRTANGAARIANVPAVERMRELVLSAIEGLPRTVMFDGVELEGEQRMDWTEHG